MSLFRPTVFTKSENCPSEVPPTAGRRGTLSSEPPLSATLHEAIMDSVSSVRDSLPEQYRAHFETLRQEIIDFTKAHGIPKAALAKPAALREATSKLSTQDLERLANLLERFEYLLKNGEPKKEDYAEALEYAEEFYHLREQYTFQFNLLKEAGILKEGVILGIDGNTYPIPTLEQIAMRLFERRETLHTKHDQGFTKLLLVPFGMSLDSLCETFKRFILRYKGSHPDFYLDINNPLWTWEDYQGADMGDSPNLVYYPQSFTKKRSWGKTKAQILEEQTEGRWTPASAGVAGEKGLGTPGWTVHLFQPSNLDDQDMETPIGFSSIPRQGQGTPQGKLTSRPPLEANKTPNEYLSILQNAQDDPDSPYFQEFGMTPEDWIMAFMTHFSEREEPLDDAYNVINTESYSCLTGAFFSSSVLVLSAFWNHGVRCVCLGIEGSGDQNENIGVRSSVIV